MVHNLKLKVLAEGVETIEQKAFLNSVSCDEFQGLSFRRQFDANMLMI
jgi:EAL domain-containing protein (putative c-di-GMP-specific phosphodiesterase class I)